MKAIVLVFVVACIAGSMALWFGEDYSHTDGRPGCTQPEEFGVNWRNNFDNVRYWKCAGQGQAVSYICPIEYLFSYERQCCVNWNFWKWTAPFDPITSA